jgi:hypothetical protein
MPVCYRIPGPNACNLISPPEMNISGSYQDNLISLIFFDLNSKRAPDPPPQYQPSTCSDNVCAIRPAQPAHSHAHNASTIRSSNSPQSTRRFRHFGCPPTSQSATSKQPPQPRKTDFHSENNSNKMRNPQRPKNASDENRRRRRGRSGS